MNGMMGRVIGGNKNSEKARQEENYENRPVKEPILISIRPTLRCNFNCDFCLSNSNLGRKEVAEWKELEKFFEQLDKAGFKGDLHICGGEPFIYKEIDRLIVESSAHAPELSVLTNASWIPVELNERNEQRLAERLKIIQNLSNTILRLSIDTFHFKGEPGKEPRSLQRLQSFVVVAERISLVPDKHYQVMVTESTLDEALKMKQRIADLLRISDTNFIKARGVYKLGRSKEGKEFKLGDPNYIAINPTLEGKLIIYAGRQEETAGIVYGSVDKLQEVIEHHREVIGSKRL
jgi:organic radical activating enzyme